MQKFVENGDTFTCRFRGKDRSIDRNKSTLNRFMSYVSIQENGCWLWTGAGAASRLKYGAFHLGKKIPAHRASLFLFRGIKPFGTDLVADHLCRNPSCVNPDHLEMVTTKENNYRGFGFSGANRRKTHCPAGHPYKGNNLIAGKENRRACKECARTKQRAFRIRGEMKMNYPNIEPQFFKEEKAWLRLSFASETLIVIIADLISWAVDRSIPLLITDTVSLFSEDLALNRKSATHREGRAFDLSIRGLTEDQIKEVKDFLEGKFGALGAVSSTTGRSNLVVDHDSGAGRHLHVQLRREFARPKIQSDIERKYV